ncbi:MAG TPA: polysaccharide deacetylase family protein [Acidobacteriaceae bacterium]|nr:polysaccharide deacetylase family protein [Acidobacteriaceae bacterium]
MARSASIPGTSLAAGAAAVLAAGAYAYAAMWPKSQIFGNCVVAGRNPHQIALTFDDGPNDPYTMQLLDILAKHNVRATFFLIGRFVRQRPDLVRALAAAGHLIGNHTMTHPLLPVRSPRAVRQELQDCNRAIEDALGQPVQWFRPPHGGRRPDVLRTARELGLTPVMWNAMGYDWKPTTSQTVVQNVLRSYQKNRTRGFGTNVLLHDGGQQGIGQDRSHTVAATAHMIPYWRNEVVRRGETCEFVTLEAWEQLGSQRISTD